MSNYHQLIIVGRLARDPESRFTPDGTQVTNFTIPVDEGYGDKKHTIWMRITTWGKLAETCNQYLTKGRYVVVEGRLNADPQTGGPRIWNSDGGPRASFEMTANTVKFLSSRDESESAPVADEMPF